MTAPRPWGCPKCGESESLVRDTARDEDGYIVRRRRCQSCSTFWSTEEIPIAPGSYWSRAHSRNVARTLQHRVTTNPVCFRCGEGYVYGFWRKHVAFSKVHAASLKPTANGASRDTARRYAREWARRRRAA